MVDLDRATESHRERDLMDGVRTGRWSAVELHERVPRFPLKIQIQTASPCSASCVMCPWPDVATRLPQGRMDGGLFRTLVDQLAGRGVERTSLFLMNEPLLDKRLEEFTVYLKERVPETSAVIYSNGERFDGARARALAAAGMDEVNISLTGFDRSSYERTMQGVDFERVMANLVEVAAARDRGELGALTVRIVGLEFPGALDGQEAFTQRTGWPVFLKPVTNRAGSVDPEALGAETQRSESFHACQRPFVKAYVLYNGDVCLCNCDWERTTILGNLAEQTLAEVWQGEALAAIRVQHLTGQLANGSLCSGCDYPYLPS